MLLGLLFLAGCAGPAGTKEQSSSDLSAVSSEETGSQKTDVSGETITGDKTSADTQTNAGDPQNTMTSGQSEPGTSLTIPATTKPAVPTTTNSMEPVSTTLAAGMVSLYINCVNAVKYGIRDRDGYKDLIPENGVMLDTSAEFQQGDTVLALLKRALKDNGIILNIKQSSYVAGIGGLNQFDCGTSSGWIYSVNGIFPLTGSRDYKLASGDRVAFYYTVKKGDVPGKQDF